MKYDFITIGGATLDISFFTDAGVLINNKQDVLRQKLLAFEYGAKIRVDKFYYSYGGGAANSAVCLANFGLRTACLSYIGDDEPGRKIKNNLKKHQVKIDLLTTLKSEESGFSFVLIAPSGERIIFGSRGANRLLNINSSRLKVLKKTKNIYIASLTGDWVHTLKNIFSVASAQGPKLSWNPGEAQIAGGLKKLAPFIRKTQVFALNKDEAIELVLSSQKHRRLDRNFLNKTENLIKVIKSFGPQIVLITLGADGVMAYDGRKIYRRRVVKEKKRVDTTGIGDVFNSSFVAGLEIYQGDIDKSLQLGLKNTAAKISHWGAQNGLLEFKK